MRDRAGGDEQMTTIAWFNCFAGISGDMALGSLLDAGADEGAVREMLERLPVDGWALRVEPTQRAGIGATRAVVDAPESPPEGTPARDLLTPVIEANLPSRVQRRSLFVIERLRATEARIHRADVSTVHLHELGGIDTIIDVVGTCAALETLEVDLIYSSPVTVGRGSIESAHGVLPNPPPAVVELLNGAPVRGIDVDRELTTPTGAAIVASLAAFGAMPQMTITASGFGAGRADIDGLPNVTQVVIGETQTVPSTGQPVELLEVNVDDVTGEVLAATVAELLDAGAHDAWITPIVMKKGRPAYTVSALADQARSAEVRRVLLQGTGSLGVRGTTLNRWPLARREEKVTVEGHVIGLKIANGRVKVEHDDALRASHDLGIALREVIARAEAAWRSGAT